MRWSLALSLLAFGLAASPAVAQTACYQPCPAKHVRPGCSYQRVAPSCQCEVVCRDHRPGPVVVPAPAPVIAPAPAPAPAPAIRAEEKLIEGIIDLATKKDKKVVVAPTPAAPAVTPAAPATTGTPPQKPSSTSGTPPQKPSTSGTSSTTGSTGTPQKPKPSDGTGSSTDQKKPPPPSQQ